VEDYKPRYRGRKEYALIYLTLITAAIKKEHVTYDDISNIMYGKPIQGPGMAGQIGYLLGEININELKYNRPLLTAVVINKNNNPGPGFFDFAIDIKKLHENSTNNDKEAFYKEELAKVYATWQDFVSSKFILSI
jgi:hypothetical protein